MRLALTDFQTRTRRGVVIAFLACAVWAGNLSVASAGVITFGLASDHSFPYLGLDGAGGQHNIEGARLCDDDTFTNCEDIWNVGSDVLAFDVIFTSGPLLSLTPGVVSGSSLTWYEYGPGEIAISASLASIHTGALTHIGDFHAPVGSFTIEVIEEGPSCGPCPKERFGSSVPLLGEGWFDPELAAFLGVGQRTTGGAYLAFFLMEFITGDPMSAVRIGESWTGLSANVETTVPEPHLAVLGLVGMASVLVRRLRRAHS